MPSGCVAIPMLGGGSSRNTHEVSLNRTGQSIVDRMPFARTSGEGAQRMHFSVDSTLSNECVVGHAMFAACGQFQTRPRSTVDDRLADGWRLGAARDAPK